MTEVICRDCDFTGTLAQGAKHSRLETGNETVPGVPETHNVAPGPDFIEPASTPAFEAAVARAWEVLIAAGNPEKVTLEGARRAIALAFATYNPAIFSGDK